MSDPEEVRDGVQPMLKELIADCLHRVEELERRRGMRNPQMRLPQLRTQADVDAVRDDLDRRIRVLEADGVR